MHPTGLLAIFVGFALIVFGVRVSIPKPREWKPVEINEYLDFPYKPIEASRNAAHRMTHAVYRAWIGCFPGLLSARSPMVFVDEGGQARSSVILWLSGQLTKRQVEQFYQAVVSDIGEQQDMDIQLIVVRDDYTDYDEYVRVQTNKQYYDLWKENGYRISDVLIIY